MSSEDVDSAMIDASEVIAAAITDAFDRGGECCDLNIVSVVLELSQNTRRIADAITDTAASPGRDDAGRYVGCLTEAVMSATNGLHEIATAISDLASAVRETR